MHVAMRVAGRGTGRAVVGVGSGLHNNAAVQRVMLRLLPPLLLCVIIKSEQKMQPKKIRGKRRKTITTRNHKRPSGPRSEPERDPRSYPESVRATRSGAIFIS